MPCPNHVTPGIYYRHIALFGVMLCPNNVTPGIYRHIVLFVVIHVSVGVGKFQNLIEGDWKRLGEKAGHVVGKPLDSF